MTLLERLSFWKREKKDGEETDDDDDDYDWGLDEDREDEDWKQTIQSLLWPLRSALMVRILDEGIPPEQRGMFYFLMVQFHEDLDPPLYVYSALPAFLAAPTGIAPVDSTTLTANARAAQALNTQFTSLQLSDACTTGQNACISNATVSCVDGKWAKQVECSSSQICAALPSVRGNGTGSFLPFLLPTFVCSFLTPIVSCELERAPTPILVF